MKFYKELSKVYDIVFPKDDKVLKFLCKDIKHNSKILDLACGTGTYSNSLALKGHRVDAMDIDEDMINIAKGKGGLYSNFIVGDMVKLKEDFLGEKYDLIYCIGNSIVHLKNKDKIKDLIKDIYHKLNDDGSLIIQIVNYDRVINQNVKMLPTIDRKERGIKFIRNYNYDAEQEKVEFQTELIISNGEKEENYQNSVQLVALKKEEIKNMFEKAGFEDIKVYGGFGEEEFSEDSFALVIKGSKK